MLFTRIKLGNLLPFPWETHNRLSLGIHIKYLPDGFVERHKAWLIAKGYTRTYEVDYLETFSPMAHLNLVHTYYLLFLALYQLDIKNACLHGELWKEVYMDQLLGYVVSGCEHLVC